MKCPTCASEVWAGFDGYVRCENGDRLTNDEYNALTLEEQQKADGSWEEPTYTLEEARALLAAENVQAEPAPVEPEPVLAHPDITDIEVPPAAPAEMDAAPPAPAGK